jgi:hypothetical protein
MATVNQPIVTQPAGSFYHGLNEKGSFSIHFNDGSVITGYRGWWLNDAAKHRRTIVERFHLLDM